MIVIRAVVFDIGGVMIRLAAGWENACRAGGVEYRPFAETPAYRERLDMLERKFGCGQITSADYYSRLFELVDGRYPLTDLRMLHMSVIQQEFPGIYEVVRGLREAGYFTACLSNTCAAHWDALDDPAQYPAIGLLNARFASQLMGLMKPDPAIFRRFEEATGFHPQEILYFDDMPANVAAAQQCGWQAVLITQTEDAVPEIQAALSDCKLSFQLSSDKRN